MDYRLVIEVGKVIRSNMSTLKILAAMSINILAVHGQEIIIATPIPVSMRS